MSEHESVNEGTSNKGKLQDIAVRCIKNYPANKTLRAYSEYLCFDIKVSARTALESYILPMMRHGYFIHVSGDIFTQAQNEPQNSVTNKCKNCGKTVPDKTTFCSKDCVEHYKTEHGKQ